MNLHLLRFHPRLSRLWMCLGLLLVLMSLAVPLSQSTSAQGNGFLTISGTLFTLDGQSVMLRGSNIGNIGALGIWQPPDIGNIESVREDYVKLKEMGGNHFRFGMSLPWYNQDRAKFWRIIDQQVAWAKEAGVWFLPLLFVTEDNCYEGYNHTCKLWTDAEQQQRLIDFWVEMARRYRDEPTVLGFDYLNEPNPPGPGWCSTWFDLAQRIRDAVYAVHPDALAFIEACADGQFYHRFKGDNIVYQVHLYEPLAATHNEDGGAVYPGWLPDWDGKSVYWSKDAFRGNGDARADIRHRLAINWAKGQGVPIYIGEWGTRSPYQGWQTYLTDIAGLLNEWHTHWAHYTWRHLPGWWDTFALGQPLRVQNPPTYAMLLWAFQGKPGPADPDVPTPTRRPSTATSLPPTYAATVTKIPASATWRPSLTPVMTATLVPRKASLRVDYMPTQRDDVNATIEAWISLVNEGSEPINLRDVTVRYYFAEKVGLGELVSRCEAAAIRCDRIASWFGQLDVPRRGATHYLELGFADLTLAPGQSTGMLSMQIYRRNWHDFTQRDDYSFGVGITRPTAWERIVIYHSGRLIWGVEPEPLDPKERR